jgi:hypothetical protein
MNWPWRRKVVILDKPPLSEDELAGAFAITESDVRFRAIMQVIGSLEREATEAAQIAVASPGISASSNGGALHLSMLRDRIIELQQKGFGKLDSERNIA